MNPRSLRPVTPADGALLELATLGNLNWCGERFTLGDVRERPAFAHYTRLDPARGDFGVVAMVYGEPVGVGWAKCLPDDDPGYGHVDADTPELSLWVAEHMRGQGIGRRLLRALVAEARARQVGRLSLSVEAGNRAKRLYLSEGFTDWPGGEPDGIMTLELAVRGR